MTEKENYLRAVRFAQPEHIPMAFCINGACYQAYPHEAIFDLMEAHPLLFPDFRRPEEPFHPEFTGVTKKGVPFRDDFGCVWNTTMDGITGTVTEHPLADWEAFSHYRGPNPHTHMGLGPVDWDKFREDIAGTPEQLHVGSLRHGHTFLQLCDLRGYENLIFDMADEDPRLWELIALVEDFNLGIVRHFLECGVDVMSYPEDLGMQNGPMLSPAQFRKYIQPSYRRLMEPARNQGIPIHMHSDGDIRTLTEELVDGGVDILNLQDLVNGIDWIAHQFAGRVCVELDIDRQKITRYGTPSEIDDLIRREVSAIGSRDGGLMMIYGWYPGVPLENAEAVMDAMERYTGYFR